MKKKYYIIWIEGFSPRGGEKLLQFTNEGYSITTMMTHAMRFKQEHLTSVIHYLKRHGVADWVLDNPDTFVETSYAPAGTLFNPNREQI